MPGVAHEPSVTLGNDAPCRVVPILGDNRAGQFLGDEPPASVIVVPIGQALHHVIGATVRAFKSGRQDIPQVAVTIVDVVGGRCAAACPGGATYGPAQEVFVVREHSFR